MEKRSKKIKHSAEYFLFRFLYNSLKVLPARSSRALLGVLLKTAGAWKLDALGMRNLDIAYGDSLSLEQKKKILRGVYTHLARIGSELKSYWKQKEAFLDRMVIRDASLRHFDEALAKGRGVIATTPHFGNWEIIPGYFSQQGYAGAVIGKRLRNQDLNRFLVRLRSSRGGMELIYQNESPRKILRRLKENYLIGILPDADTKRLHGIYVDFFGQQTYSPTGPATLALASGAPIIPCFLTFDGKKYRMSADPPLYPQGRRKSAGEIERLTLHWTRAFEKRIRKHPDQWIWFQRRWVNLKTPEKASG